MVSFEPKSLKVAANVPHDRQFSVCRFSPDGTSLFAAGHDGKLYRLTPPPDGAAADAKPAAEAKPAAAPSKETKPAPWAKRDCEAHRGWVEALVVHAGTKRLFSADSWGQVRCWQMADSADKRDVQKPDASVLDGLRPEWTIESACASWLRSMAVSVDGRMLATCGNDAVVRLFSTDGGRLLHELPGHESPVFSVAFTPDGTGLAAGDLFGAVRHWSTADGKLVRQVDAKSLYKPFHQYRQGGVRAMTFDPAGRTLFCGGFEGTNANQAQGNPTVVAFDWQNGAQQTVMTPADPFSGPIMDLAFHASGLLVGAGSSEGGGALWFWKPGEAKALHTVKYQNSFRRIDVSADGARLAAAAFGDLDGQRGGNGRKLDKNGEYPDFGGSVVVYAGS